MDGARSLVIVHDDIRKILSRHMSSKMTSGPHRWESVLASAGTVAGDSRIILWNAKMYFRGELASKGQLTRRRFCVN